MRFRHLLVALLAGLLAVGAPALTTTAAAAPGVGSIYGNLYDDFTGDTLPGASIAIWPAAAPTGPPLATIPTDVDGSWQYAADAGSYLLRISKAGFLTTEQAVIITEGGWQWVELRLQPDRAGWGTLTGTVKVRGKASGCASVTAFTDGGSEVSATNTLRSGTWALQLPPGSYNLQMRDGCGNAVERWAPNAETQSEAAAYQVTTGTTTTVPTVNLPDMASVSGTVTNESGKPLGGVLVKIFNADNGWWVKEAYTDEAGRYTVTDLEAGEYKVAFDDDDVREYLGEWHADQPDESSATVLEIATAQVVTGIDAVLAADPTPRLDAAVVGTVTDRAGKPIRGLKVSIYLSNGDRERWTRTDTAGRYQFDRDDISAGKYRILAEGELEADEWDTFVRTWYGGARQDEYSAPLVTVDAGATTTLSAISMVRTGTLSGTTIMPTGSAFTGGEYMVSLYDADGALVNGTYGGSRGDAEYTLGGIRPGRYFAHVRAAQMTLDPDTAEMTGYQPLISRWWKTGHSMATAAPITVTAGGKVTGINFTLTRTLTAVVAPKISGKAKVGKKLTATSGTWNQAVDVGFSYTWKRGSKTVGTGTTYKIKKGDAGKKVTVVVKATDAPGYLIPGTASAKAVKVPKIKKKRK